MTGRAVTCVLGAHAPWLISLIQFWQMEGVIQFSFEVWLPCGMHGATAPDGVIDRFAAVLGVFSIVL
jgi:hypothetical protein